MMEMRVRHRPGSFLEGKGGSPWRRRLIAAFLVLRSVQACPDDLVPPRRAQEGERRGEGQHPRGARQQGRLAPPSLDHVSAAPGSSRTLVCLHADGGSPLAQCPTTSSCCSSFLPTRLDYSLIVGPMGAWFMLVVALLGVCWFLAVDNTKNINLLTVSMGGPRGMSACLLTRPPLPLGECNPLGRPPLPDGTIPSVRSPSADRALPNPSSASPQQTVAEEGTMVAAALFWVNEIFSATSVPGASNVPRARTELASVQSLLNTIHQANLYGSRCVAWSDGRIRFPSGRSHIFFSIFERSLYKTDAQYLSKSWYYDIYYSRGCKRTRYPPCVPPGTHFYMVLLYGYDTMLK